MEAVLLVGLQAAGKSTFYRERFGIADGELGLVLGAKRSLALGEFALGVEGLEHFVRREPRRRVHACVFSVLALESEPVDPRL